MEFEDGTRRVDPTEIIFCDEDTDFLYQINKDEDAKKRIIQGPSAKENGAKPSQDTCRNDILNILLHADAVTCTVTGYEPMLYASKALYEIPSNHQVAIGTKVIVRTCDDYGGRHCGRVGMVCKHFAKDKKVGVMFEGIKNTASKDGIFWFQDANLTPYKEPSTMLSTSDVKSVIFNGGKTIVLWADGTKTISTCGESDTFDPYAGFCAAVAKKVFGSTGAAKRILKNVSKITPAKKEKTLPETEG